MREGMNYVLILNFRYFAQTNLAATILLVISKLSKICHLRFHHDYNLYSFLARLPLHIFWRKMMMPGIN